MYPAYLCLFELSLTVRSRMFRLGLDVDEEEEEETAAIAEDDDAPPPLEGAATSAMEEID